MQSYRIPIYLSVCILFSKWFSDWLLTTNSWGSDIYSYSHIRSTSNPTVGTPKLFSRYPSISLKPVAVSNKQSVLRCLTNCIPTCGQCVCLKGSQANCFRWQFSNYVYSIYYYNPYALLIGLFIVNTLEILYSITEQFQNYSLELWTLEDLYILFYTCCF